MALGRKNTEWLDTKADTKAATKDTWRHSLQANTGWAFNMAKRGKGTRLSALALSRVRSGTGLNGTQADYGSAVLQYRGSCRCSHAHVIKLLLFITNPLSPWPNWAVVWVVVRRLDPCPEEASRTNFIAVSDHLIEMPLHSRYQWSWPVFVHMNW